MKTWLTVSVLALLHQRITHAYQVPPPISANPCGNCTYSQPYYWGGWWTTGQAGSTVSIEAVTVLILTNNGTNATRTTTIFNFPPDASVSPTNSDGYVLHTQTIAYGSTTTTAVLTWPTGYASYQQVQSWEGVLAVTAGQGLNASSTCLSAGDDRAQSYSVYPTPIPPAFPTPYGDAGSDSAYDKNAFYQWRFVEDSLFAQCEWPYGGSVEIDYTTYFSDFPVYQTCWQPGSSECGAIGLATQEYLTVTKTSAESHSTSSSTPAVAQSEQTTSSEAPSPAATTSAGPPKTTSQNVPAQSEVQPSSSQTKTTVAAPPKETTTSSPGPEPSISSTIRSFTVTTNAAGTTVAVVGTQSGEQTTFSTFHTTTDQSGNTVAVVQPTSSAQEPQNVPSSTATSFRVTTNGAGTTVAVVGTKSGEQTTFSSFHTTTDQSGNTVAVVQPTASQEPQNVPSSTATSFRVTTNAAGSSVVVVGTGSGEQTTFSSFRTTTDQNGETVAIVQPTGSSQATVSEVDIAPESVTTEAGGQTVALVQTETAIPLQSFTVLKTEGGSVETLTGTAALPAATVPFFYTSGSVVLVATPTTDAEGHTVIELPSVASLPIITNSAGSSFVQSVVDITTTVSTPFTYVTDGHTTTFTPFKGHSVVTFESTETLPLDSMPTTDVGGYVASGVGVTGIGGGNGSGGSSSPTGSSPSSTMVEESGDGRGLPRPLSGVVGSLVLAIAYANIML